MLVGMANYLVSQLDTIDPKQCPCGITRRAFGGADNPLATVHRVEIQEDARKTLTEIYVVLEGEGSMELDGELIPIRPMTSILIKPGCRHRAVGRMTILNVVIPAFDPADEWFD